MLQHYLWRLGRLGPFQTSNFTCMPNLMHIKLKQKTNLIYIELGTCEVRRLKRGLNTLLKVVAF